MRTLAELTPESQTRVRNYVKSWPTVSTEELAEDLYLRTTTVAAIRAHLRRQEDNRVERFFSDRFNQLVKR